MKKSSSRQQDPVQPTVRQPEKAGWIRKFCGRGIFRELWRNRFVVLRGDHLYVCDKEVKEERKAQEVFHLADYERSEELRKAKSRSKKNHSRFTLLCCKTPGNTVPNLVFLAVSPEDKESWVNALNVAIIKAKTNQVLDEVQVTLDDDDVLTHPTRERAKVPHGRRLPTRGHLLSVAPSSSHGMLTLDLVTEEDSLSSGQSWENSFRVDLQRGGSCGQVEAVGSRGAGAGGRHRTSSDVSKLRVTTKEPTVKTGSLPRGSGSNWRTPDNWLGVPKVQKAKEDQLDKSAQCRSRCSSLDQVLSSRPAMIHHRPTEDEPVGGACVQPVGQLQSLIAQKMQRAQELLEEMRLQELQKHTTERGGRSALTNNMDSPHLHHLRGSDSAHCSRPSGSPRSRSSDSPRLHGKESPHLRGRDSPRSRAKKNRCRGTESPRSRQSNSPAAKANGSALFVESNASSSVQKSCECPPSVGETASSQFKVSEWSGRETLGQSSNSQADSPQAQMSLLTMAPSLLPEEEVQRRRAEVERLLQEAVSSWKEAQEVLQEVKELQSRTLRRQRRLTHDKMTSSVISPAEEDTPTSPTSAEKNDESETP